MQNNVVSFLDVLQRRRITGLHTVWKAVVRGQHRSFIRQHGIICDKYTGAVSITHWWNKDNAN